MNYNIISHLKSPSDYALKVGDKWKCVLREGLQFVDTVWEHKDLDLNSMRYAGRSRIQVQYHNKTENIKQSLTLKRIFEEHNACPKCWYPLITQYRIISQRTTIQNT